MNTDQYYMQRCLELAQKAKEEGESAIGSIVILEGLVLFHRSVFYGSNCATSKDQERTTLSL